MPLEEHDWDILQRSLDGVLTPTKEAELAARMSREPELKAAMSSLRSGQVERATFWKSLEPTQLEADVLAKCALSNARRRRFAAGAVPWWPRIAAVAACLIVSFSAGWFAHSHQPGIARVQPTTHNPQPTFRVALTDEQGHVTAVQDFESADQAKKFARDVMQWQELNAKVQHGSPIVLADRL